MNQEKVGLFIAKLRKEKNMTQSRLAEKIGVTDKAISKWENGRGMPDISSLTILSKEFDVSLNELISGERLDENNYQQSLEENVYKSLESSNRFINKFKLVIKCILIMFFSIMIFLALESVRLYYGYGKPLIVFEEISYVDAEEHLFQVYHSETISLFYSIKYTSVQDKNANDLAYTKNYGFYLFNKIKLWEHNNDSIEIYKLVNVLDRVNMKVKKVDNEKISVIIEDYSNKNYVYNDWFRIDRIDMFGWYEVGKVTNPAIKDNEYLIDNGLLELDIDYRGKYQKLTKGKYKLIKYLYDKNENSNKYFFVEFEV